MIPIRENTAREVTAVITTHNRETEMVKRALSSVLAQTCPLRQIIIVDDSDREFPGRKEIRDLAAAFPDQGILYVPHSNCKGLSAARNTGLTYAAGKYIAYLDDDDEWLPEKTALQLSAFEKEERSGRPMPGLVYGGGWIRNDQTGKRRRMRCRLERGNVYRKLLGGNWIGYPSFVMFRKACLDELGGFDSSRTFMEDYDLYLRLARRYPVSNTPKPVAIYHEHEGGQMTDHLHGYIEGMEAMVERFGEDLSREERLYRRQWMRIAYAYAEIPNREKAYEAWETAFSRAGRFSMARRMARRRMEGIIGRERKK